MTKLDYKLNASVPVAWMYEQDGCVDRPIFTEKRWPVTREPWTETPLYATPSAEAALREAHAEIERKQMWLDVANLAIEEATKEVERLRALLREAKDRIRYGPLWDRIDAALKCQHHT